MSIIDLSIRTCSKFLGMLEANPFQNPKMDIIRQETGSFIEWIENRLLRVAKKKYKHQLFSIGEIAMCLPIWHISHLPFRVIVKGLPAFRVEQYLEPIAKLHGYLVEDENGTSYYVFAHELRKV